MSSASAMTATPRMHSLQRVSSQTGGQTSPAHRRQRVRSEMRTEPTLRAALPHLPPLVAEPVACLAALFAQICQVHQSTSVEHTLYDAAFAEYGVVRLRVFERTIWLREYGAAVYAAMPPDQPLAQELAACLGHDFSLQGHSLATLVTTQRTLDVVLARCEYWLAEGGRRWPSSTEPAGNMEVPCEGKPRF